MDAQNLEQLVTTWMEGWAHARGYSPKTQGRAFLVERHDRDGLVEKLIVCPSADELRELSSSMDSVDHLTVITQDLAETLAVGQSAGLAPRPEPDTLMVTDIQQHDVEPPLPPGDGIEHELDRPALQVIRVRITVNGQEAAHGTVSVVDQVAVFDKIGTHEGFRRRGLASYVMRLLTHAALDADVETGLLAASPDGRHLYQHLGWDEVASVPVFESAPLSEEKPVPHGAPEGSEG